jgi:anti-anti-sigma regulatory factor
MPVSCDEGEALSIIRLQGDMNICSAAEFKRILLLVLAHGKDIRVDLSSVTELDVSVLQLLWAAEREAKGAGVGLSFTGQCPQEVALALAAAGFEKFPPPAKRT